MNLEEVRSTVQAAIANGWLKLPDTSLREPLDYKQRTVAREKMRQLRARRYANGLTSDGQPRITPKVRAIADHIRKPWAYASDRMTHEQKARRRQRLRKRLEKRV